MATMNFPTAPALNDLYLFGGSTWQWNGTGWKQLPNTNLPVQTGNAGKYLTTDGATTSWAAVAGGSPALSMARTSADSNGLFTVVTYKRQDTTNYRISTLSGGTSPQYTTRTVVNYGTDGTTVTSTEVYTLSYADGINITSEVLA